jgi:hypothetical protein
MGRSAEEEASSLKLGSTPGRSMDPTFNPAAPSFLSVDKKKEKKEKKKYIMNK